MIKSPNINTVERLRLSKKELEILHTCQCAKNLITSIYQVEKQRLIYYNNRLEKILERCCHHLLGENWAVWFSLLVPEEVLAIKTQLLGFLEPPYLKEELLLKYHIPSSQGKRIFIKHEIRLYELENKTLAVSYFSDISDLEQIERCFHMIEKRVPFAEKQKKLQISRREQEVLGLIANGFSSKEIADILFISNHTAISHRKNLIEKFKVKNTAHLIKKAVAFIGI